MVTKLCTAPRAGRWIRRGLFLAAAWAAVQALVAQPFQLPTANRAVLQPGAEDKAFVGTVGHEWPSGTFGCVRSGGAKFHEGIDIRCLQRDKRGEPTDPVMAAAAGTVAYINRRPSLSNYGNYVVLRHYVDGLEVYTLYGHLGAIEGALKIGDRVAAGQRIATLGRTANTREGISKDRAHLHFEIDLVVNDHYIAWHAKRLESTRNDHGNFNGRNLLGMDPWAVFKEQEKLGAGFSLLRFIQSRPEICRVAVRGRDFPWVKRYRSLIEPSPRAEREGVAGYEMVLGFNGLPLKFIPRAASELKGGASPRLLSVNRQNVEASPCGHIVVFRDGHWQLRNSGAQLLDLVTFRP